jgi:hypothetical protein
MNSLVIYACVWPTSITNELRARFHAGSFYHWTLLVCLPLNSRSCIKRGKRHTSLASAAWVTSPSKNRFVRVRWDSFPLRGRNGVFCAFGLFWADHVRWATCQAWQRGEQWADSPGTVQSQHDVQIAQLLTASARYRWDVLASIYDDDLRHSTLVCVSYVARQ